MLQVDQHVITAMPNADGAALSPAAMSAAAMTPAAMSPAAMARHLRRSSGDAALCFAQAIHDDSAWANEAWASYWAAVVRLV